MSIAFQLNGRQASVDVAGETPLLWVIRDVVGLKGTKFGCGIGMCGACVSIQARCNGWRPSGSSPSIVVICAPATALTGVMQERMARPSRCTVHAPHMPIPHPNFVPLRPTTSRITQSSGVSPATSTDAGRPLI